MPSPARIEAPLMRNIFFGAAITLVALTLGGLTCLHFGIVPVNADSPPSPFERWAARTALIASVSRSMNHGPNPAHGPVAIRDGAALYRSNCEFCHGSAERAQTTTAEGLYQKPPQFATEDASQIPYGYLSWVITHGIRLTAMPAFGERLSRQQVDDLTLYVSHMKTDAATPQQTVLRPELRPLFAMIDGVRTCTLVPAPGARTHHFVADAQTTLDGAFITERFFNRGISEYAVLGYDSVHHQYERTVMTKNGTLDVAVARPPLAHRWVWRSVAGATPGTELDARPNPDGSYDFFYVGGGGSGHCSAPGNRD